MRPSTDAVAYPIYTRQQSASCAQRARRTRAVRHAREAARHEFQAALALLHRLVHLAEVVDCEEAAGKRSDEVVADGVDVVHALWRLVRRGLAGGG